MLKEVDIFIDDYKCEVLQFDENAFNLFYCVG